MPLAIVDAVGHLPLPVFAGRDARDHVDPGYAPMRRSP